MLSNASSDSKSGQGLGLVNTLTSTAAKFASTASIPSKPISSSLSLSSTTATNSVPSKELLSDLHMYPKSGKRLISAFSISDCLQIVNGSQYYVFDPLGTHILQDSAGAAIAVGSAGVGRRESLMNVNRPRALRSQLVGGQSDLLTRFPDQFASLMSLPIGLANCLNDNRPFPGIILRLPLRQTESTISSTIASLADIKHGFRMFKSLGECSLLFGTSMTQVRCSHWNQEDDRLSADYEVSYRF